MPSKSEKEAVRLVESYLNDAEAIARPAPGICYSYELKNEGNRIL